MTGDMGRPRSDAHNRLRRLGLSEAEASATCDALQYGEDHGKDTHGFVRVYNGFLADCIDAGLTEPGVEPVLTSVVGGRWIADARGGIGYYALHVLLETVLSDPRAEHGFQLFIDNLYPTNALGQQISRLCDAGYVAFVCSRSPLRVVGPVGTREVTRISPVIGTNAQAWGAPGPHGTHLIIDTTLASFTNGDTHLHGPDDPPEWFSPEMAFTHDGLTPGSWAELFAGTTFTGSIRPLGGSRDHRAFGMLMVAEMLSWMGTPEGNSPGATFVMGIRPPHADSFLVQHRRYRDKFHSSADLVGTGLRLPGARRTVTRGLENVGDPSRGGPSVGPPTLDTVLPDLPSRAGAETTLEERLKDFVDTVKNLCPDLPGHDTLLALASGEPGVDPESFFDAWSRQGYTLWTLPQHKALVVHCLAQLEVRPEHRLLDLGAGDGRVSAQLPTCSELTLLDISEQMLLRARERTYLAQTVHYYHGAAHDMPDGPFDRVVAIMSLHHVPHDEIATVLTRLRAAMAPGGLLYLGESFVDTTTLTNPHVVDHALAVYARKVVNAYLHGNPQHALRDVQIAGRVARGEDEHMRSRTHWRQLLEGAGFTVRASQTTAPEISYGYVVAMA